MHSNQWDCFILYRQQITSNGFFFMFAKVGKGRLSSYIERFWNKQSFICSSLFRYYIKQIDSMLPCICSVIDHRRRQNVVRTSVTHLAIASCATFLFLSHFDVICDLLLNRRTATWNLFVKWNIEGISQYAWSLSHIAINEDQIKYQLDKEVSSTCCLFIDFHQISSIQHKVPEEEEKTNS